MGGRHSTPAIGGGDTQPQFIGGGILNPRRFFLTSSLYGGDTQPQILFIGGVTPLNPRLLGIEKHAPHKSSVFLQKRRIILAKKTYLTTYQGWKEEKWEKQWQKNLLDDLPGVKRRKFEEQTAKK